MRAILVEELETFASTTSIDGLKLSGLAFVDIGEVIRPANVVPVEGSLIFPNAEVESSLRKTA